MKQVERAVLPPVSSFGEIEPSSRIGRVRQSATMRVFADAQALKARGVVLADLGVGEPDLDTPAHIVEAAAAALKAGRTRYTGVAGTPALREAAARWLGSAHGLSLEAEDLMVTSGAKQALYNALQAMLENGDEVVMPSPCWPSYKDLVVAAGGTPVVVSSDPAHGFSPDPEQIEAAFTDRTRALVLSSPANPTGAILSESVVRDLVARCARRKVVVISDDIYRQLWWTSPPASIPGLAHEAGASLVIVDGVSKAYRMTGFRIGFCAAPRALLKTMCVIQGQSTSCACSISQAAAEAALTGPQDCLDEMRAEYAPRARFIAQRLLRIPGVRLPVEPTGAFYAFADLRSYLGGTTPEGDVLSDDVELARWLLTSARVVGVPGSGFEAPGYMRLSYARPLRELEEGLDRLERALRDLVARPTSQ